MIVNFVTQVSYFGFDLNLPFVVSYGIFQNENTKPPKGVGVYQTLINTEKRRIILRRAFFHHHTQLSEISNEIFEQNGNLLCKIYMS